MSEREHRPFVECEMRDRSDKRISITLSSDYKTVARLAISDGFQVQDIELSLEDARHFGGHLMGLPESSK